MDIAAHLLEQADHFRNLARVEKNIDVRRQLFSLAKQCEDLALTIQRGPSYQRAQGEAAPGDGRGLSRKN